MNESSFDAVGAVVLDELRLVVLVLEVDLALLGSCCHEAGEILSEVDGGLLELQLGSVGAEGDVARDEGGLAASSPWRWTAPRPRRSRA